MCTHMYNQTVYSNREEELTWKVNTLVVDICLIWKHDGYFGMLPCNCRSDICGSRGDHMIQIIKSHDPHVIRSTDTLIYRQIDEQTN